MPKQTRSYAPKILLVSLLVTVVGWSMAFVFAAAAGELPFPNRTLGGLGHHLDSEPQEVKEARVENLAGIEKLEIKSASSEITFTTTDDKSVHIDLHGQIRGTDKNLRVERSGNELLIQTPDSQNQNFSFANFSQLLNSNSALQLDIAIPKDFAGSLKVVAASGDIKAQGLNLQNLGLQLSSGQIQLKDCRAKSADVKTSSGDIELTHFSGPLSVVASSGRIEIKNYEGESLKARTTSGDIELADIVSDNVEVRATSGNVKVHVKEASGWKVQLQATSGEISNQIGSDPGGNRKLAINVTSGDISVTK